jgi:protein MAK11
MAELNVVVGTYEGALICLAGSPNRLKSVFALSLSSVCIRTLRIKGELLIGGGYDEMIRVLNLERRVELGSVLENLGTINSIDCNKTHALTANDSGSVAVWRMKDWNMLHQLKVHSSGVTGVSLHPSERMAISIGKDKRLVLWNLIRGRPVFQCKFAFLPEEVQWSPNGQHFAVRTARSVNYFDVQADIKKEFLKLSHPAQVTSFDFLGEDHLIVSAEITGHITVWDAAKHAGISIKVHESRVISVRHAYYTTTSGSNTLIVVTLTSLGEVGIWALDTVVAALQDVKPHTLVTADNSEELLVASHELNRRCSSLAVTTYQRAPSKI